MRETESEKTEMFIHQIDYSEHFSHSDSSISSIKFLKFNANEWKKYDDNRNMCMNRLRHDDYLEVFENGDYTVLKGEPIRDENILRNL
jgi:hypothetical protein